jgi:hypothetical protein
MKAKLDSSQEEIKSKLDVCLEKNETWSGLHVTDLEDSQDEEPEAVMEWQQISNHEAIVETIRAREDRHLAVQRPNSRRYISRTMVGRRPQANVTRAVSARRKERSKAQDGSCV